MILTENEAEAEQECKTFKEKTTSNRVIWATFKIQKMDNGGYSNKTELLEKISEFRPSNIILDFAHENITDDNSLGHKDKFGNWVPKCVIPCNQAPTLGKLTMDLFNAHLLSEKYLQNYGRYIDCIDDVALERSSNCMFFHLYDIWDNKTHGAVFMSGLTTTGRGWKKEVLKLNDNGAIPTNRPFKTLVLSGTHGGQYKDGDYISGEFNTSYSGFTAEGYVSNDPKYKQGDPKGLLEGKLFTEDQESAKQLRPILNFQENSDRDIKVLNMEDFNKQLCEKKNPPEDHREKLLRRVQEEKPDLVVFAWCYSTNGDVCMALRQDATLSRMIVEAEMRRIGIKDAKIDSDQVEVLKKAQDPKIKDIILTGGTGSGKTIIGAEVVKIWMAQQENEASVSAHHVFFYLKMYSVIVKKFEKNVQFYLILHMTGSSDCFNNFKNL